GGELRLRPSPARLHRACDRCPFRLRPSPWTDDHRRRLRSVSSPSPSYESKARSTFPWISPQRFLAVAFPPLRPAALCCAVVPPCFDEPPDPDFLPPRFDAPGEFAILAARSFDIPFFFSASYCSGFFTLARVDGISVPPKRVNGTKREFDRRQHAHDPINANHRRTPATRRKPAAPSDAQRSRRR